MSALTGTAIGALPGMLMQGGNNNVAPGAATGYGPNNQALLQLLGGKLNGAAGVSGGQMAAGLVAPLFANTKSNSSPLQDIARAMSMGRPINDSDWAKAGLPAGGGDTGAKLHASIFGAPTPPPDAGGGALGPGMGGANNPYIGVGALPIPARDPNSLVAPTPGRAPNLAPLMGNGGAPSRPMPQGISQRAFQSIYAGSR